MSQNSKKEKEKNGKSLLSIELAIIYLRFRCVKDTPENTTYFYIFLHL